MQTFELPDVALMHLIQAYSRPLTRPDWRTCKRNESICIEMETTDLLDRCFINEDSDSTIAVILKLEMLKWTHYGRIQFFDRPHPDWDGVMECWYMKRCAKLIYNYKYGVEEHVYVPSPYLNFE